MEARNYVLHQRDGPWFVGCFSQITTGSENSGIHNFNTACLVSCLSSTVKLLAGDQIFGTNLDNCFQICPSLNKQTSQENPNEANCCIPKTHHSKQLGRKYHFIDWKVRIQLILCRLNTFLESLPAKRTEWWKMWNGLWGDPRSLLSVCPGSSWLLWRFCLNFSLIWPGQDDVA